MVKLKSLTIGFNFECYCFDLKLDLGSQATVETSHMQKSRGRLGLPPGEAMLISIQKHISHNFFYIRTLGQQRLRFHTFPHLVGAGSRKPLLSPSRASCRPGHGC